MGTWDSDFSEAHFICKMGQTILPASLGYSEIKWDDAPKSWIQEES